MTKESLWQSFVDRNPSFAGTEQIRLSPRGLRKLFDTVWSQAYDAGFDNGSQSDQAIKDVADAARGPETNSNPFSKSDIFKEMFGGKDTPFKS